MKRMIALLLALTLALALAVPANAEGAAADEQSAAITAQMREQAVALLGGTPGQINVLLNDRCIAFTDAVPASRDGRTMVPLRATLETMGATVDYDRASGSAIVTGEKVSFTHRIGSDTIVLRDGAVVQMDVASYVTSENRTMVPVRFFSQVLGYDVFWDNDYQLVFLLDRESMTGSLDRHFGVLNAHLAGAAERFEPRQNYREDMTLAGTVRVIDPINGDRSYPYSMAVELLSGRGGMNVKMRTESGSLSEWLWSEESAALPVEYRVLLAMPEMEMICGGKQYLRIPLPVAELGGAGIWYAMEGTDYAALYGALYGDMSRRTVGGLCYAMMLRGDENHFFESWSEAGIKAGMLVSLLGDETFTRVGSSDTWHFGLDELAKLAGGKYSAQELRALGYEELSFDMTLRADGSTELKYTMAVRDEEGTVLRRSGTVSGSDMKTTMKGCVQVSDAYEISFEGTSTVHAVAEEIVTAPPEGAVVIDLTAAP